MNDRKKVVENLTKVESELIELRSTVCKIRKKVIEKWK